jgi:DNA primase/replicative DNA helicase
MISTVETLMAQLRLKLGDYLALHDIDTQKKFLCIHKDHDDTSPSMSLAKEGTFAKCFSCSGPAVDIFSAANILEDKPLSGDEFITDNVFYLAKKFNIDTTGIHVGSGTKSVDQALKYNYMKAYKVAAEFLQEKTSTTPIEAFLKETRKRKWAQKESIKLGVVGGCSFNDLLSALRAAGFTNEFLKSIGLMRPDIFNNDSIIFIIYDEYSNPIAFYSRDTKFEEKKIEYDKRDRNEIMKENAPIKYNSSANYIGIYEKSKYPYGIHDVKNFHRIMAVEGHGCRHNLKLNGYDNAIALGGLELTAETLQKLSSFGVTNISLFLDNDDKGTKKIKQIIKEYYGKSSIEFSVLDMSEFSDIKDPDELIRKHGGDTIKLLQDIHCLEWLAIKELEVTHDQYGSAKTLSEFIALERSPVNRLKLINTVSHILDVPVTVITEEVDMKISNSLDRKGEFAMKVLDEAREIIKHNPNALATAMHLIETKLVDLEGDGDGDDLYSSQECLRSLINLKERCESGVVEPIIKTGWDAWDKVSPFPTREAFCLLVAAPNVGKSAKILTLIPNILEHNQDAMVVAYTNDDSRDIYFNRLVAIIAKMPMKWIERPKMYLDAEKSEIRDAAFKKVMDWVSTERLIIKDISSGATVEYYGKLLSRWRAKYPDRNIFSTLDNLHRMRTEAGGEDRERVKYISSMVKSYTTKYSCVCLCSVEMTKANMYERVTDCNAIAETAALQYDANLIIFLWNEIASQRDKAKKFFTYNSLEYVENHGYVVAPVIGPVVEAIFLKNKISDFKGSLFFKFFPTISYFEDIGANEVERLIAARPAGNGDNA